jgi:hypothetical protein
MTQEATAPDATASDPQLDVFTAIQQGMQDAEEGASLAWLRLAAQCVETCARTLPRFTTDDVWAALQASGRDILETERNPSAIGVVMRAAQRAGTIRKVPGAVTSARPSRHGQLLRVWQGTGRR